MEKVVERKLLYYEKSIQLPMSWYGAPIYKCIYRDVKTGEEIILNVCSLSQDISKTFGEHYYSTIMDAAEDFDILWVVSDEEVRPIDDHFIHVQGVYEGMVRNGISSGDINTSMIEYFKNEQKGIHR